MTGAGATLLTQEILDRCDQLARHSEEPGKIRRTFLSEPMRAVHQLLTGWMKRAGMDVRLDPIGNLIGHYPADRADAPRFLLGSHLDTVPDAGRYDGILGVLLAVAAVENLQGTRLPFGIDVLAFSEEEGIRFRVGCMSSMAVAGCFAPELLERKDDDGVSVAAVLRNYGLDPDRVRAAAYPAGKVLGYLEAHIEQGPVLEARNLPLGIVEAIVGISRFWLRFEGNAGHAGTLPMDMRQDALTAAAEFVVAVEEYARFIPGLRATVGQLTVAPGAVNVVPGSVRLSLDVRHQQDTLRENGCRALEEKGVALAATRGVRFHVDHQEHRGAVPTDPRLSDVLDRAARVTGHAPLRMPSGAGHDAAIMARLTPMTMLFVRSPGGISHHPAEAVLPGDVEAALAVMTQFIRKLGARHP